MLDEHVVKAAISVDPACDTKPVANSSRTSSNLISPLLAGVPRKTPNGRRAS